MLFLNISDSANRFPLCIQSSGSLKSVTYILSSKMCSVQWSNPLENNMELAQKREAHQSNSSFQISKPLTDFMNNLGLRACKPLPAKQNTQSTSVGIRSSSHTPSKSWEGSQSGEEKLAGWPCTESPGCLWEDQRLSKEDLQSERASQTWLGTFCWL